MLLLQHFTKYCKICDNTKMKIYFSKSNASKDGLQHKCKLCESIRNKQYGKNNRHKQTQYMREYRIKNRDYLKEYTKSYRLINRVRISMISKAYRILNREKLLKYDIWYRSVNVDKQKQYYLNNKHKQNINSKKYYINNIDAIRIKSKIYRNTVASKISTKNSKHKRRAITKRGDVTTQQLLELQQNAKICYWCNKSLKNVKVHIDHYVALSKGGEHTLSNLVVSCEKCNKTKNAKDPIEFANSIGKLL